MKTGHSNLPLHGGSCPRWLFEHMKELAGALVDIMLKLYSICDQYSIIHLLPRFPLQIRRTFW